MSTCIQFSWALHGRAYTHAPTAFRSPPAAVSSSQVVLRVGKFAWDDIRICESPHCVHHHTLRRTRYPPWMLCQLARPFASFCFCTLQADVKSVSDIATNCIPASHSTCKRNTAWASDCACCTDDAANALRTDVCAREVDARDHVGRSLGNMGWGFLVTLGTLLVSLSLPPR